MKITGRKQSKNIENRLKESAAEKKQQSIRNTLTDKVLATAGDKKNGKIVRRAARQYLEKSYRGAEKPYIDPNKKAPIPRTRKKSTEKKAPVPKSYWDKPGRKPKKLKSKNGPK